MNNITTAQIKKYQPLVYKLTKQFSTKIKMPWDDICSMAWEGLVLAFNNYDETRSNMSFLQYAAFSIRNNILNCLNKELRTVEMPAYAQKKAKEEDKTLFTSVSMTVITDPIESDNVKTSKEYKYNLYETQEDNYETVMKYFYERIDNAFSDREREIFYMSFGLKNYDNMKGKDIANTFKISEGRVSQIVKKVIEYIKGDSLLRESLGSLMNK